MADHSPTDSGTSSTSGQEPKSGALSDFQVASLSQTLAQLCDCIKCWPQGALQLSVQKRPDGSVLLIIEGSAWNAIAFETRQSVLRTLKACLGPHRVSESALGERSALLRVRFG